MTVTTVRRAALANLAGQAFALVVSLAMIPVYLRWLGIEAYGLLGLFITLAAASAVLDVGFSGTVNRELARGGALVGAAASGARDLVRSLEWLVWPVATLIGLVVAISAGLLAAHWLRPVTLSVEATRDALMLMAAALAAQWPVAFYTGALAGLERQVQSNLITMAFTALRGIGVLVPLALVEPSVHVYFAWHAVASLAHAVTLAVVTWRALPAAAPPARFDRALLARVGGFTGGMALAGLLSFLLMHADRIVLSRTLPLDGFALYALAISLAAAVHRFIVPVQGAVYPRYSQLVAAAATPQLAQLHHRTTQVVAVVVVPCVATMAVYAREILALWTGDAALAAAGAPVLALLVVGYGLNGLMLVPYALQLAHGRTRLQSGLLLAAVVVAFPCTWWAATRFGALGAAAVWLGVNVLYVAVGLLLLHRRMLRGELLAWLRDDTLPSVLATCSCLLLARMLLPEADTRLGQLLLVMAVAAVTVSGCVAVTRFPRAVAANWLWIVVRRPQR